MSAYSGVFPRFISGWAGERGRNQESNFDLLPDLQNWKNRDLLRATARSVRPFSTLRPGKPCRLTSLKNALQQNTLPQSMVTGMESWRAKSVKIAYKIVLCFIILSTMALLWACSEDSGWTAGMYGQPMNSANFGQVNSNGQVVNSGGQTP
jgi:hypothetical protein